MKFTLLIASLAALAFAAPPSETHPSKRNWFCVTQWQAQQFVTRFIGILNHQGSDLGNYVQTAEALLAENFQEVSDSINSLAGFPLGSVTTPSKQAYIAGMQHGPPDAGISTLFVTVANCNHIVWHWNFAGVGSGQYPVKGFNYFTMQNQWSMQVPWVASELQLEFNSIAWALDTGFGVVLQNGTTLGKQGECSSQ